MMIKCLISLLFVLFCSTCFGSDIITGTWVIEKEVYSTGYISRTPSRQEKRFIGKKLAIGDNYINFKGKKYAKLIQKTNVLSLVQHGFCKFWPADDC